VRGQTTAKPLYPPRKRGGGPTGGDMPVAKPRKPKGDGTGMLPRPKKPKPAREEEAFVAAARRGAERAAEEDGEEGDDDNLAANRPKRRNYLTTLESIRSTMSHHGMMASEKEQMEWAIRGERHRTAHQPSPLTTAYHSPTHHSPLTTQATRSSTGSSSSSSTKRTNSSAAAPLPPPPWFRPSLRFLLAAPPRG